MESKVNQMPKQEEVRIYYNDFIRGFIRLTKKLFML